MKKIFVTVLLLAATGVSAQQVQSMRNIFGGEDFYDNGGYIGYSAPNIHGGRDFYPSPNTSQRWNNYSGGYGYGQGKGFYGYHGSGNPHLQDGYAIGAGLSQFFNAFRGNR